VANRKLQAELQHASSVLNAMAPAADCDVMKDVLETEIIFMFIIYVVTWIMLSVGRAEEATDRRKGAGRVKVSKKVSWKHSVCRKLYVSSMIPSFFKEIVTYN